MISMENGKRQGPLLISIGGGKGGVGKSMVSSNLAVQYALAGMKVVLLDLDFGAANLHTIFGKRQPPKGLGDYFTTPRSQLQDYLMETELPNLFLVPGSGFVPELANLRHMQKLKLINQMKRLNADLVMLDLGAGSANNVVDFFSMTQAGAVVTTPEPTAIVNAYEFLKNVVYRILFRMFRNNKEIGRILKLSTVPNNGLKLSTVADIIYEVKKTSPWSAKNIEDVCRDLDFYIIFNQARKYQEANLGVKLREICLKHLCLDLNYSGVVYFNEEVSASIFKMRPISLACPNSVTSKTLTWIATHTMKQILNKSVKGESGEPFEQQHSRVMKYAKQDFEANLLVQKSIERKHLRESMPHLGNMVNLHPTSKDA